MDSNRELECFTKYIAELLVYVVNGNVCVCGSNAGAGQPAGGAEHNDLAQYACRAIQQEKRSHQCSRRRRRNQNLLDTGELVYLVQVSQSRW